jgi:hypothetical protein
MLFIFSLEITFLLNINILYFYFLHWLIVITFIKIEIN